MVKGFSMSSFEYGLKTGALTEPEMIKIFEKALNRCARESADLRIAKGRKKMKKHTGPFGSSTPGAKPAEYDHTYFFDHRYCGIFLELYPNMDKNGVVKFLQEGVVWNLYIFSFEENSVKREFLENMEMDAPEGFGIKVMREIFRTLPCEKIFIKEYIRGENRL